MLYKKKARQPSFVTGFDENGKSILDLYRHGKQEDLGCWSRSARFDANANHYNRSRPDNEQAQRAPVGRTREGDDDRLKNTIRKEQLKRNRIIDEDQMMAAKVKDLVDELDATQSDAEDYYGVDIDKKTRLADKLKKQKVSTQ